MLESETSKKISLDQKSYLIYKNNFLSYSECIEIAHRIHDEAQWRNDKIKVFGRVIEQPRKVAFFSDKGVSYTYSKIKMYGQAWTNSTLFLREKILKEVGVYYNSCLLNLYRSGKDYMSWHSDDEKELGSHPQIVSISIGAARDFLIKDKLTGKKRVKIKLESGSFLQMGGHTQKDYCHMLPKRMKIESERYNFTFRNIVSTQ